MIDVFISYSRDNHDIVRRLADAVRREGYAIWWDDELPAHRPYGDVITEKIDAAKAAIVIWSRSSAQSEWVRAEADLARNQKKLIQASIDGHPPPLPFNQIQFASIGDWRGEDDHPGWRKVKASLAELCGARTGAAPAAPARPIAPPVPPHPPRPAAGKAGKRLLIAAILVSLLVIGAIGALVLMRGSPGGTVASGAAPAEIFPDSSRRRLTGAEIAGLSRAQLRIARNEIYARRGRRFQTEDLRRHFERYSWYRPRSPEDPLGEIENANVVMLAQAEGPRARRKQ